MLTVCTLLWDANRHSESFSRSYDESWVEKLQAGFRRNLSKPFRFVCFTEKERQFSAGIDQHRLSTAEPSYASCIEPYRLNVPMILVGLDTIITGNIDHLADYCFTASHPAYPRDPFSPSRVCNGVALVPQGHGHIYVGHRGENDMEWVRRFVHADLDELFPGHIVSYKGHVTKHGLGDARIVYFHGARKPHELSELWIAAHWRS